MKRFFLSAFFASLIILPGSVFAENKPSSNLGSILDPDDDLRIKKETRANDGKSNFNLDQEFPELPDVLRWELALTSKAFKTNDNLRTRSDLITATSKGVEFVCLGELQSSFYQSIPPEDPACLRLLKLLESLDSESPIARCARYGIDSELCLTAYKTQRTKSEIPRKILTLLTESNGKKFESNSFENNLSVKLEEEKVRSISQQTRDKLEALPALTKKDKKFAEIEKQRNLLTSQYVQQTCTLYRLVTIPVKIIERMLKSQPKQHSNKGAKSGTSLSDLLTKGPFKSAEDSKEKELSTTHYRLTSTQCLQALDFAAKKNPSLPAIPCLRDGITSPTCITARRATPASNAKGPAPSGGSGEGIERF